MSSEPHGTFSGAFHFLLMPTGPGVSREQSYRRCRAAGSSAHISQGFQAPGVVDSTSTSGGPAWHVRRVILVLDFLYSVSSHSFRKDSVFLSSTCFFTEGVTRSPDLRVGTFLLTVGGNLKKKNRSPHRSQSNMPIRRFGGHRSLVSRSHAPQLSYGFKKMNVSKSGYRVFSANSSTACTELAKKITERLGVELGKSVVYQESNRETRVDVKESVRGQDIFIIQTIPKDVNTAIMELLVMAYALKTSCAKNIIGVIPYFPYSKQCKMRKRGSIVCKLLASMLAKAGLTHIITMDLHQKEIQGFFSFPVDNLRASPFLIQYIREEIPDYRNAIIVAKSPSAAKRAQSYAERLRLGLAVMHGEAHHSELDMVDGRQSPPFSPPVTRTTTGHTGLELPYIGSRHHAPFPGIELPMMMAKEKPPITVVGDVGGRIAIIVDDIIDDVEDFVAAAEILKERGAYKIYIMATHGLLSADAPRLLEESAIDEVVVTNTVPHEVQKLQCPKIKTVDVSMILAEAIRRIHNGESMAYLFRNIAVDD